MKLFLLTHIRFIHCLHWFFICYVFFDKSMKNKIIQRNKGVIYINILLFFDLIKILISFSGLFCFSSTTRK